MQYLELIFEAVLRAFIHKGTDLINIVRDNNLDYFINFQFVLSQLPKVPKCY